MRFASELVHVVFGYNFFKGICIGREFFDM